MTKEELHDKVKGEVGFTILPLLLGRKKPMLRCWFWFALIVLCVLAATNTSAQKDLFSYGREWNVWSNGSRSIYLAGFVDGQSNTYLAVYNDLPPERREPLRLQTFMFYEPDAIRDVMTNLYSDPANTYIRYDSMVYIARDKLSGKDIEPLLRSAREKDRGYARPPK